jgi:pyruvate decarboxylase
MGKGAVDESLPTYGGYYGGGGSFDYVREYIDKSDALLFLGRYAVS